jgi:hypothetical protein
MSTYWHYECLDHSPTLQSDEEFTQHTDDKWFKQGVEMAMNRPQAEDDGSYWRGGFEGDGGEAGAYFRMNALKFLHFHPTCRIGLINEYGERRELDADA